MSSIFIPTSEKQRLQSIDYPFFWLEVIDTVGPKPCDEFNHRMGAVNDATV